MCRILTFDHDSPWASCIWSFKRKNFAIVFSTCRLRPQNNKIPLVLAVRPAFRANGLFLKFHNCNDTPFIDISFEKAPSPTTFAFPRRVCASDACDLSEGSPDTFHHTFVRPTRTISPQRVARSFDTVAPHICASDTHDLGGIKPAEPQAYDRDRGNHHSHTNREMRISCVHVRVHGFLDCCRFPATRRCGWREGLKLTEAWPFVHKAEFGWFKRLCFAGTRMLPRRFLNREQNI